jgi:hypothetical protein
LLCKEEGNPPSREHFFPGGLGVHADVLLPLGAVCERCNNRTGSKVDEPLTKLPDILFMRGLLGIPDNKGRRVERMHHSQGTIEFTPEGPRIQVFSVIPFDDPTPEQGEVFRRRDEPFLRDGEGDQTLTISFDDRDYAHQVRHAARSVLKMGLYAALLYIAHGPRRRVEQ